MRCDKEIGRIGHWHQCDRTAVVTVASKTIHSPTLFMNYCDKHKPLKDGK
jgi:hypothetical protein